MGEICPISSSEPVLTFRREKAFSHSSDSIMTDLTLFWKNPAFRDATVLLSSNREVLEQKRSALQDSSRGASTSEAAQTATGLKKRKLKAGRVDFTPTPPTCCTNSTSASPAAASSAEPAAGEVLTIPVHRLVLTSGSEYFRTAISTLIGDSETGQGEASPRGRHPIIVLHEEDVEAAQGVLEFLYTRSLASVHTTASQFMHLALVSYDQEHTHNNLDHICSTKYVQASAVRHTSLYLNVCWWETVAGATLPKQSLAPMTCLFYVIIRAR